MKIVVISDTHIGHKNSENFWKEALYKAYEKAEALDGVLIHSGDWFDMGSVAPPKLVNEVIDYILDLSSVFTKVKLYTILGNHDIPVLNSIKKEDSSLYVNSPLYFLEQIVNLRLGLDSVKVINSFFVENFKSNGYRSINIFFQSFLPPKLLEAKLKEKLENKERYNFSKSLNGIVLHTSFNGFKLPSGKVEENGIDIELLKDFDFIINGHIHSYYTEKNLLVVGSPYQMKFGDSEGSISILEV